MATPQEKNQRSLFFRARLAALLIERGITQRELAAGTDLTPQSISHYLRGTRHLPGAEELYNLARYFNVSMESFLGPSAEDPKNQSVVARTPTQATVRRVAKRIEQISEALKIHAKELGE